MMFCVSSTDDNHGRRRPRAQGPLSLKQLIFNDDKPLILGETSPYMATRSQIYPSACSQETTPRRPSKYRITTLHLNFKVKHPIQGLNIAILI